MTNTAATPTEPNADWPALRLLRLIVAAGALVHLGLVAWIIVQRLDYAYELEWIEGSSADTVHRVLQGKAIYVEPSLDYTPYLYTPLYYWTAALVAKVIGMGMLPLRLVSFAASIGTALLVAAFVRRETKSWFCALVAAGLLAASFKATTFWFDIARVDCLFVFFTTAAVYAMRVAQSARGLIAAGVLLALAFLSKQSALFVAGPLALYTFFAHIGWWRRLAFPIAFGTLAGVTVGLLSWASDGWFYYYAFTMPSGHIWLRQHYLGFWSHDLMDTLPFALLLAGFAVVVQVLRNEPRTRTFYPLVFVALVGGAWLSRVHSGSGHNVILPACVLMAMYSGVALHRLLGRTIPSVLQFVVLLACVAQWVLPLYDPRRSVNVSPLAQLPTAADRAAGDAFVARLRQIDGDVFMSHPAFIATYAGKVSHSDGGAMNDIFRAADQTLAKRLEEQIRAAIRSKRYAAIVVSKPWLGKPVFLDSPAYVAEVEQAYDDAGLLFGADGAATVREQSFVPVTGMPARPDRLYLRKP